MVNHQANVSKPAKIPPKLIKWPKQQWEKFKDYLEHRRSMIQSYKQESDNGRLFIDIEKEKAREIYTEVASQLLKHIPKEKQEELANHMTERTSYKYNDKMKFFWKIQALRIRTYAAEIAFSIGIAAGSFSMLESLPRISDMKTGLATLITSALCIITCANAAFWSSFAFIGLIKKQAETIFLKSSLESLNAGGFYDLAPDFIRINPDCDFLNTSILAHEFTHAIGEWKRGLKNDLVVANIVSGLYESSSSYSKSQIRESFDYMYKMDPDVEKHEISRRLGYYAKDLAVNICVFPDYELNPFKSGFVPRQSIGSISYLESELMQHAWDFAYLIGQGVMPYSAQEIMMKGLVREFSKIMDKGSVPVYEACESALSAYTPKSQYYIH